MGPEGPQLVSRYQGCLVGLGVGDALGAPLEGMSRLDIERRYGRVDKMMAGGWHILGAGDYTDDTAMMLCIAHSIVERRRFDPGDIASRFLQWFDFGPIGIGRTTMIALSEMKKGTSWKEAGRLTHQKLGGKSAGNGSIMRCAPIALLDINDEKKLIGDSIESSRITHWDDEACWGAAAVNLIIARLLVDGKDGLLQDVMPHIENSTIREALEQAGRMSEVGCEPTAYVLDTLKAALCCFLSTQSFEEALVEAVNLGGDTDTVGAVCGAMAGAHYGIEAIPQKWEGLLQGREEMLDLASRIHSIAFR